MHTSCKSLILKDIGKFSKKNAHACSLIKFPLNLVFSGENRFRLDYSIQNAVHYPSLTRIIHREPDGASN